MAKRESERNNDNLVNKSVLGIKWVYKSNLNF